MPRFNFLHNSFQYGELSPRFLARTDTEQYVKGAKKIENMIVLPTGGARRRPGTVYVGQSSTGGSKVIPFIFSKTEAYHIVLYFNSSYAVGQLFMDVYAPQGVLTAKLLDNDGTTPELSSGSGPVGGTSMQFGTSHPLTQADFDSIQYVQSGDLLFCTMQNHEPFVIARTQAYQFTIGTYASYTPALSGDSYGILRRPYRDQNLSAVTLVTSAQSGNSRTLTATLSGNPYALFDADMVGTGTNATYFKLTQTSGGVTTTGVCAVRGFTSSSEVTVDILIALGGGWATPSTDWYESAWSYHRGWPEAIGAYEGRLIFANNDSQPDTIWGSETIDTFNLMQDRLDQDLTADTSGLGYFVLAAVTPPLVTDPFSFTPLAREVNRIGWLQSGRSLVAGSSGQEFVAQGSAEQILSTGSVNFSDQTTVGSAPVQAIRANKSTLFVSRDGKRVYNYDYEFLSQSYIVEDLTALADHIVMQTFLNEEVSLDAAPGTRTASDFSSNYGIKSLHWQPSRQVLWIVTETGDLIGATWNPAVKTIAWHRHILGGYNDGAFTTRPFVLSAAVVPTENGLDDVLSLLVQRVTHIPDGTTVVTLEIIGSEFSSHRMDYQTNDLTDGEAPIFMDAAVGLELDPASDTVDISDYSHLWGSDVDVLYDGKYYERLTVDALSHSFTLKREASFVLVGLPYTPKLQLPNLDAGSPIGSAQGMMVRVDRATIRFDRTLDAKLVGPESEEPIDFRDGSQPMGDALPLFSGDKIVNVPMGPERKCELEITSDKPYPLTILGVVLRGQLNE